MHTITNTRSVASVGLTTALLLGALGPGIDSASAGGTLPEGPPWHRDFVEAHAKAAAAGKPLFVYFTKTY